jgi:hypothetical protein
MATKTNKTKPSRCLVTGCKKGVKSRGLCACHYQSAENSVKAGKASWEELVRLGVALEARKLSNGFSEFLEARRKAKSPKSPAAKKAAVKPAKTTPAKSVAPAPVKSSAPVPGIDFVPAGGMAG